MGLNGRQPSYRSSGAPVDISGRWDRAVFGPEEKHISTPAAGMLLGSLRNGVELARRSYNTTDLLGLSSCRPNKRESCRRRLHKKPQSHCLFFSSSLFYSTT